MEIEEDMELVHEKECESVDETIKMCLTEGEDVY